MRAGYLYLMSVELSQQFSHVATFLEAIEPLLPAYRSALLSYVAVVHEGEAVILRAALRFSTDAAPPPRCINQSLSLRAGQRCFDKLKLDLQSIEAWIRAAVSEQWLPTDDPLLKLLPESTRRYSAYHESTRPSFARSTEDAERLQINGAGRDFISRRQKPLERELHEIGLDSFDQLMRVFGLKPSDETSLEISVAPVAKIDSNSQLIGTQLQLIVQLARGLDQDKLRITVCDADISRSPLPHSFASSDLKWSEREGYWIGSLTFTLDSNAVVSCRAVYCGRIQHEIRLADPRALPNSRRMVLNIIDGGVDRLWELLTRPKGTQRDDFEAAVGVLFQLLGFSPAAIGGMSQMQDEPDFFLEAADGEILVVECSTDVPPDKKFMNLVSRARRTREELSRLTSPPIVLPMLIVPVQSSELDPIRDKASTYDVLILSLPEINAAIARTQFAPNARETLREWRRLSLTRILMHGLDGRQ